MFAGGVLLYILLYFQSRDYSSIPAEILHKLQHNGTYIMSIIYFDREMVLRTRSHSGEMGFQGTEVSGGPGHDAPNEGDQSEDLKIKKNVHFTVQ